MLGTVRQVPVVIVGAGPTGVTAATLVAQYGVECLVLERWPGVYPQPRAVHLDDEIYRVLAGLGVADDFAAISRPTLGLRLLDNRFHVLAEFNREPSRSPHGFPQANMFDQPELEAVLRANLQRYACAEVRGNAEVTEITETEQGVRVSFTDRGDGRVHRVDATYLLGCDGANSTVRAQIGSAMRDLNFEQRWLVIDVATETDLRQWDGVHQVCDPNRAGTYMRIAPARYRWEFQLLDGETADDFGTLTALRPLIAPWTAGIPDGELTLLRLAEYTFRAQIADRWRRGNIFILGDAAHLTPPFIGQGMGAGVRDAANLAWKIAGVLHGTLAAEVLDSYEQERKPHTRAMIRLALTVGRSMTGGGRLGTMVRRVLLPRLRLIPGLRDKVVDSTTPALHASALVRKSRGSRWPRRSHRLTGTLCPNPRLTDGRRLDAVLGMGFAVITSSPLDVEAAAMLRQRLAFGALQAQVLIAERGTELEQWLRQARATAAIVRPDRTVMLVGRDPADLCARTAAVLNPSLNRTPPTAGRRSPASGLRERPHC